MLKEIEQQVVTIAGKALPDADVSVAPPRALIAGKSSVTVALRQLATEEAFQREQQLIADPLLGRARLLPVAFLLRISVRVQPATDSAESARDARETLLEHVAHIAHALGDPDVRSGKAFTGGTAAGFIVESFALAKATVGDSAAEDILAAELRYRGTGSIWPPSAKLEPVGKIERVHSRIETVEP